MTNTLAYFVSQAVVEKKLYNCDTWGLYFEFFSAIIIATCNKLVHLPFTIHPSLIFSGKAGAYQSGASYETTF